MKKEPAFILLLVFSLLTSCYRKEPRTREEHPVSSTEQAEDSVHFHTGISSSGEPGNGNHSETDEKAEVTINNSSGSGPLILNEKVTLTFELTNISSVPFLITDVHTNDSLIIPQWDSIPVNKGEKATVSIRFQIEKKGSFYREITITSNAKDSPHIIILTGKAD